jgi:pimeloyl-ACP methyl ester carboxylesterase
VIVLVHAGIGDASMWDGFDLPGAERHELRGFGNTPLPPEGEVSDADDLEARLGDGPVALVGASFGGQVCLEVAARRPELVSELVLLDARVPDHDWSEEIIAFAEEEDRLIEEGDLDAAADLNARFWAPSVADRLQPMQRRSFELQVSSAAEPAAPERIDLGAIRARTLVVVGEDDKADFRAIAARLAEEIPDAELVTMPGVTHLPSLERPDETAALVRGFLGG